MADPGQAPPGGAADDPAALINNLKNARRIVLQNAVYYPAVLPAIREICANSTDPEARRRTASLISESFAAPTWSAEAKEPQALASLELVESLVSENERNTDLVMSGVQIAANIYRIVFKYL